jgi:hypothetical protein
MMIFKVSGTTTMTTNATHTFSQRGIALLQFFIAIVAIVEPTKLIENAW